MRTLYLRNVPDDVMDRLEDLAGRDGMSLNAFVVRHLSETSRYAENAALLAELPTHSSVSREDILAAIDQGRTMRDRELDRP